MAELIFSSSDQAHEESYVDVVPLRKNVHAFISHLYPPFYIQVMDAFANYRPLDYEHIALNRSIHKVAGIDIRSSSSNLPLQFKQTALKPLIQKVTSMDLRNSSSQVSVWDKTATSSSSEGSDWTSWSTFETCDLKERINHHFVEFTDPLEFPSYVRSLVVYPYVPIDHRRRLEENLLIAWYTSSMPTKIVHARVQPIILSPEGEDLFF